MKVAGRADIRPDLLAQRLIPRPAWAEYFMAIAKVISTRSTCSSRPVGCVITRQNRILVTGYNGPPPGEPHCTERGRDGGIFCLRRAAGVADADKQGRCPAIHAEENAVALAEKLGVPLAGATAYVTLSPCGQCIARLARAGVAGVYYELRYESIDPARDEAWEDEARRSFQAYGPVSISPRSLEKIVGAMRGLTSERLLPSA